MGNRLKAIGRRKHTRTIWVIAPCNENDIFMITFIIHDFHVKVDALSEFFSF
jgi:hypothetical protein